MAARCFVLSFGALTMCARRAVIRLQDTAGTLMPFYFRPSAFALLVRAFAVLSLLSAPYFNKCFHRSVAEITRSNERVDFAVRFALLRYCALAISGFV